MEVLQVPKVLVTDTKRKHIDPLAESHIYAKLGSNGFVDARPSVLHFGGYQVDKTHTQLLRIVNVSSESQRIHILNPTTKFFTTRVNKKGLLAPGMSEDIYVDFTPTEWRYYYDCIRIHCEGEKLLVPMHGYPVMNDVVFPKLIDFGACAVGSEVIRYERLECKIPINFEFEFTIKTSHSDFQVSPMTGIVPANGFVDIQITYSPSRLSTSSMEIQVNISQFGFTPFITTVLGSGLAGAKLEQTLSMTLTQLNEQSPLAKTAGKTVRVRKSQKPITIKYPEQRPPTPDAIVDGVVIPRHMDDLTSVNFVLTQEPGKLKLRDLKMFIETQKQKSFQNTSTDDDSITDPGRQRQAREMQFEMGYRKLEGLDREKEIKFFLCRGDVAMTQEEAQEVKQERIKSQNRLESKLRELDRSRYETVASVKRPVVAKGREPQVSATFDIYKNDTITMRRQVLERFVRIANKAIVRARVNKRLRKIQLRLATAKVTNRQQARIFVEEDWKASISGMSSVAPAAEKHESTHDESSTVGRSEGGFVFKMSMDRIRPTSLPSFWDSSSRERVPVEVNIVRSFNDFAELPLKEGLEYKIIGYKEHPIPTAPSYLPKTVNAPIRVGAEEERRLRGERGVNRPEIITPLPTPPSCVLPLDVPPASLVKPHPVLRPFVPLLTKTEVDLDHYLQPANRPRPEADPALFSQLPGKEGLLAVSVMPSLSMKWRPRREITSALVDVREAPPLLTGPLVGDEQSDTDSDHREGEFRMPAPPSDFLKQFEDESESKMPQSADMYSNIECKRDAQLVSLHESIRTERFKWSARLPYRLEQLNAKIEYPGHKLSLR
eukprot:GILK01003668.1.p1 GENE.GILK01003668.1~~GILK01003668.1.p1  ORF type:complete len:832 (-),score=131.18 GILK01003668.1:94-2589(-)